MRIFVEPVNGRLGPEEKMIALKILLVIYIHNKRYRQALKEVNDLLRDSEMGNYKEILLIRQAEVREALQAEYRPKGVFPWIKSKFC